MPTRSKVHTLPKAVREWLDKALVENNFSGYELLEAELRRRGYTIGKSSLHRYGQKYEERLRALKTATEQAKALVNAAPDDEGAMSDALIRLVQEKLFSILIEVNSDKVDRVNLSSLTKGIANLARASVSQKKWMTEMRAKVQAAADEVAKTARKGGLSDQAIRQIEEQVLGIVR